jgi:hypothetical protein
MGRYCVRFRTVGVASGLFLCAATLFIDFRKTKPTLAGLPLWDFVWEDIGFRIQAKVKESDGGRLEVEEWKRGMDFFSGSLARGSHYALAATGDEKALRAWQRDLFLAEDHFLSYWIR